VCLSQELQVRFSFLFFPFFWMFEHRTISFGLPQVSLSFSISSCVPVLGYCVRKLEDSLSLSLRHTHTFSLLPVWWLCEMRSCLSVLLEKFVRNRKDEDRLEIFEIKFFFWNLEGFLKDV
jgi:hypothetical protein